MGVRAVAWLWLFLLLLPQGAAGQEAGAEDLGAFRDTLNLALPPPYRLRPFVVPGSERIVLDGVRLDTTQYRLDERHGWLWLDAPPVPDSTHVLVAVYRTLPFSFKEVYRRRSLVLTAEADTVEAAAQVREETRPTDGALDPFGNVSLQRSGSITRGILAGNNRDVTVESGLRLQLSGEVVDGVDVQAVLTDENTPILPEGTTQRLSEFDRVYIQIRSGVGTAQLGDFDLVFRESEFARFSRKLQGISLVGTLPGGTLGPVQEGRLTVAGATARGIFRSQDVTPIDGVQGPYRLEGLSGEQFILVVPGSETVYLDGQPLTRGETNDYVIDYALGEVTFTSRRIITDDRRITVEFQYTTNQFTRTLLGSQALAQLWPGRDGRARAHFGATFLREADSREFNEEFGFTSQDSLLVAEAGDGLVLRSGAEPVPFDPEAAYVQYLRETRSGPGGRVDTIFVALSQAPADTVTVYRVRFTRVGEGRGSYTRVGRSVNGILYEYRGPGAAEYEPVRLLPKPKRQQLLDLHGGFAPVAGLEVFGEWAQSVNDENRLSARDRADDVGHAYLGGVRLAPLALRFGDADLGRLSGELRRRYTGSTFRSFDRTRPIEFGRRWNLVERPTDATGGIVGGGDELIDEGQLQLDVTANSGITGEVGRIRLGEAFEATRRGFRLETREARLPHLDYRIEYIRSKDSLAHEEGTWLRQRGRIERPLLAQRLVPYVEIEQERRRQEVTGTDSLARQSFAFVEYRPGVAWRTERLEIGSELEYRTEEGWRRGRLQDAARAWTAQLQLRYRPDATFNTDASLGYRVKRYEDEFLTQDAAQNNESVALSWNSGWAPYRRAVDVDWSYQALSERTPTLQEIYVRTGPEFGQYVWEDISGDGIIQVDEFIPERTLNEGTYVKAFVPSDSLISVVSVQARLRLQLDPARVWRTAGTRWKQLLAKVSTRTTVEVQEKSRDPNLTKIYLLYLTRYRSPLNTLNGRFRVVQEVSFFRDESRYGVDVSFSQLRGLSELAAGKEMRFLNTWSAEGRYKPSVRWGLKLRAAWELNRVESESFSSRRYDIESVALEPSLSLNVSQALQFTGGVALARKTDRVGQRRAQVYKLPVEGRYAVVRKLQVTVRAEGARVDLTGDAVGLAVFELTDGRGPGTSFLWGLNTQYSLNQYLRATLAYDGRAPSDAPVLHTVRMQLSAIF